MTHLLLSKISVRLLAVALGVWAVFCTRLHHLRVISSHHLHAPAPAATHPGTLPGAARNAHMICMVSQHGQRQLRLLLL